MSDITDIQTTVKTIITSFEADLSALDFDALYLKYLGKKGVFNTEFANLKRYAKDDQINRSKELNKLKKHINDTLESIKSDTVKEPETSTDLTVPVLKTKTGHLHPLTLAAREMNDFFKYYGFSVGDGPEIEDDYHNFEMMGVPKDHPARDLQDTLYILEPEILLRTQTSNVEARYLEDYDLPLRIVVPGKVFRNEQASKTNGAIFSQYQGFYVDKSVTMGHLKWIFDKCLKHILGEDTVIRYRSKYYPEVEPGMSPDIRCKFCDGERCEMCKYRGWIEIAGGGMINPETLKKAKIDNKSYSGFAFGFGLDRIAMQKYNIKDIRSLYDGSIVYT